MAHNCIKCIIFPRISLRKPGSVLKLLGEDEPCKTHRTWKMFSGTCGRRCVRGVPFEPQAPMLTDRISRALREGLPIVRSTPDAGGDSSASRSACRAPEARTCSPDGGNRPQRKTRLSDRCLPWPEGHQSFRKPVPDITHENHVTDVASCRRVKYDLDRNLMSSATRDSAGHRKGNTGRRTPE